MVLGAGGKAIEPEALRPQVYLPDRHGSLQIEMLAAARRNGFVAIELKPELQISSPRSLRKPRDRAAELGAGLASCGLAHTRCRRSAMTSEARSITLCASGRRDGACRVPPQHLRAHLATRRLWAMLALPPRSLPASVPAGDRI